MSRPPASQAYLTDRCCLTCGFRGRELQGRRGQERLTCPQCRQDLYTRPARTYAEMEGLVEMRRTPESSPQTPERRRRSLFQFAGEVLGVGLLLVRPARSVRRDRASDPARSDSRLLTGRPF